MMTSGTITTDRSLPDTRRRGQRGKAKLLAALAVVAIAVSAYSVRYTDRYQEWRFGRMSLTELQREAGRDAANPHLLYETGLRLNAAGRFGEADGYLRNAVGLNPDDPRLRDAWAESLVHTGRITAAFGQLSQYARTHPDLAQAHLMLGKFYLSQISLQRATEELTRAVTLDPTLADGWTSLAAVQSTEGGTPQAIESARHAVALRPKDSKSHLGLALLLLNSGQAEQARQVFVETITLAPNSAAAHREYAHCLLAGGASSDLVLAESEARRAMQLAPDDLGAMLVCANVLLAQNRPADAVPLLKRVAEASPRDTASAFALVQAYTRLKQSAQASEWNHVYRQRQDRAEAKQALVTAIQRSSRAPEPHKAMARMLAEEDDVEGCIRHNAEALHCASDGPPALIAAANDLVVANHAESALPVIQRAVEEAQNNPHARETLGDALLALGRPEEAATAYAQASRGFPERRNIYQKKLDAEYARRHSGLQLAPMLAP